MANSWLSKTFSSKKFQLIFLPHCLNSHLSKTSKVFHGLIVLLIFVLALWLANYSKIVKKLFFPNTKKISLAQNSSLSFSHRDLNQQILASRSFCKYAIVDFCNSQSIPEKLRKTRKCKLLVLTRHSISPLSKKVDANASTELSIYCFHLAKS